jgi:hypothetical protein
MAGTGGIDPAVVIEKVEKEAGLIAAVLGISAALPELALMRARERG